MEKVVNTLLLFPAMTYWGSAIMAISLGSDYFFDVVFSALKKDFWGLLTLGGLLIVFPVAAMIVNFTAFRKRGKRGLMWINGLAGALTIAGILAFWRLFSPA